MTAKLNILTNVNIYSDAQASNDPLQNNVRWQYNIQGIEVNEPESKVLNLAPGQSISLFSGVVSTSVDGTTEFDLLDNSGSYKLQHSGGTAPAFKAGRAIGVDATTEITLSKTGDLMTATSSAGTALDTAAILVGDLVRFGVDFAAQNQGEFVIIAKTANSVSFVNALGVGEVLVLGIDFASNLMVYSSGGVQKGQKLRISEGFSVYSWGTYEILDVTPSYLIFSSGKQLPLESGILSEVQILNNSKKFLYLECDNACTLTLDGVAIGQVKPIEFGVRNRPGIFMRTGESYSAELKNDSSNYAKILVISAE